MKRAEKKFRDKTKKIAARASWLWLASFVLLPVSLALADDPPEFNVTAATETMVEGGEVNILQIQAGKERFELRVPKNYGAQIDTQERTITFTSASGSSVMTVKMSTNFVGKLPKADELRDQVARKYPSASLVQTSACHSSYVTGLLFDLFQPAAGDLTMRIRDGFISFPEGSFEFILSCDLREYDQSKLSFAWLLNSFRLQDEPARKNP